jgi:hypothetical protein
MMAKIAQPCRSFPTILPKNIGQRRADREDQYHLNEIGERIRVLIRMRRIGVEEAAPIRAHHFDDFLAGHLSLGDHLLAAFERRYLGIGVQVLRLPCQTKKSPTTIEIGKSTLRTVRVISNQKLPIVCAERRAKPLMRAMASAMPVAAETKLCMVSPSIWVR